VSDLMDMEYYNKYNSEKERTGNSSSVDTFEILDNKTVLVAHDDFILRVFDIASGDENIIVKLFYFNCSKMFAKTSKKWRHGRVVNASD
jgi:hypothetical protein